MSSMDRKQRIARLTGVQIIATGSYAPPAVVTNADLAAHGYDAEWIVQRTGILERRKATDDVAASDLAFEAAESCLKSAAKSQGRSYEDVLRDVDLIVLATMTPDSPIPSTACRLQQRLGCAAAAFDVGAACAGFMFAIATGMQFVKTDNAKTVLVVGSEVMTRSVD